MGYRLIHLDTLSASETISREFSIHASGTTAGNDHLRRAEGKNQQLFPATPWLPPDPMPHHLSSGPSQPRHCRLTMQTCFLHGKPSWTCYWPAGEPAQALTASRGGSKLFPRSQGPSNSSLDLPFHLHPSLQLFRNLNLNLHTSAIAFLRAFEHTDLSALEHWPSFPTCQNHTRPSHPYKGAVFSLKYSRTPTTPDRTTASILRVLKPVLCSPLLVYAGGYWHPRLVQPL